MAFFIRDFFNKISNLRLTYAVDSDTTKHTNSYIHSSALFANQWDTKLDDSCTDAGYNEHII